MEHLFKTQLEIEGSNRAYEVYFENEAYIFAPLSGEGPRIRFRREHDEWHPLQLIDRDLLKTCEGLLENYLLSQH